MTIALRQIADRVYLVTVSGLLTWAEFQASQVRSETDLELARAWLMG